MTVKRKWVVFDMYNATERRWIHFDVIVTSFVYHRGEAQMLTVRHENGMMEHYNPVRNIRCETV